MLSRSVGTPSDMAFLIFLKDFSCYGPSLLPAEASVSANTLTASSINIVASRSSKTTALLNISSTLVLFNSTEVGSNPNISYNNYAGVVLKVDIFGSTASNLLGALGVDGKYLSSGVQFDRLCWMGLKKVGAVNSQNSVFAADLRTNPIGRSSSISRGSNGIYLAVDYSLVCFKVYFCNVSFGFDNCRDCNASNCMLCMTNYTLVLSGGRDECYYDNCWTDYGYADCLHCNST